MRDNENARSAIEASDSAVDLYWSVRSPFCYLATRGLRDLTQKYRVALKLRPVLPLALRAPATHNAENLIKHRYNFMDAQRIAAMHRLPFSVPDPDPLGVNPNTGAPYAAQMTNLCIAALHLGDGYVFAENMAHAVFSGGKDWPDRLEDAATKAGFPLSKAQSFCRKNAALVQAEIENNQIGLGNSGHWGVPLMVFRGEPFFGQDRIGALAWRLSCLND